MSAHIAVDPAKISVGANPAQMGSFAQIGTGFASRMR
jgi:hypothetical protein